MTEVYTSLVRAALWGEKIVWPVEHTNRLLRMNAIQGTGPLVYPSVLEQEDIPVLTRQQMKTVCVYTIQTQVHLYRIQAQALCALEKAGIHAVLMKGAGLAALYPDPEKREWADVDIFVGKNQYHAAAKVMRDTFPKALKFDEELDHYKHYNLIADGTSIEIHRVSVGLSHPRDVRRYARIEAEGMMNSDERLSVNGMEVRVPEPTFNALMVFLHSWEHMLTQGANVRQLCDLALLLHHYRARLDAGRLKQYLCSLSLTDVWQLYMWMLVNYLGLPEEEAWLYSKDESVAKRAQSLMDALLHPNIVAPDRTGSEKMRKNRFVRKWGTMQVRLKNARRIAPFSPSYARHMTWAVLWSGAARLFAKDRHWE